jgi:hypothetical protein
MKTPPEQQCRLSADVTVHFKEQHCTVPGAVRMESLQGGVPAQQHLNSRCLVRGQSTALGPWEVLIWIMYRNLSCLNHTNQIQVCI